MVGLPGLRNYLVELEGGYVFGLRLNPGERKDSNPMRMARDPRNIAGVRIFVFVSSLWMSEVYLTSPLPFLSMTMINMDDVLDTELKKRVEELDELEEVDEVCDLCGKPVLLHVGRCLRSEEDLSQDKMKELWNEFKTRTKPIMKEVKRERKRVIEREEEEKMEKKRVIEREEEERKIKHLVKSLMVEMKNENTVNIEKVCEAIVKREETQTRPSKVLKMKKVPTWINGMNF